MTEAWQQARTWAQNIVALADAQLALPPVPAVVVAPPSPGQVLTPAEPIAGLAWGAKVSKLFRSRIRTMGQDFSLDPNWPMACMAFETGRTFSPSVKNPGSSATGLIQFMEKTAAFYHTTTADLALMTAEKQIDYVWLYFRDAIRAHGPLANLGDCYMAILNPGAIGKPDSFTMWVSGSSAFAANAGLDANKDHVITRAEAVARVAAMLAEGLQPENVA